MYEHAHAHTCCSRPKAMHTPKNIHTYIHTYTHTHKIHTYIHKYTHRLLLSSNRPCIPVRTYIHTYIQTNKHTLRLLLSSNRPCTPVRTYIHTYIHTYKNTNIHSGCCSRQTGHAHPLKSLSYTCAVALYTSRSMYFGSC